MLGLMTSYYRHRWCSERGKPNFRAYFLWFTANGSW